MPRWRGVLDIYTCIRIHVHFDLFYNYIPSQVVTGVVV